MDQIALIHIATYLGIALIFVKPLGWYMSQVFQGQACGLHVLLRPLEKQIYRFCSIDPDKDMDWKQYLLALLCFNCVSVLCVYAILRLQQYLPLNPQSMQAIDPYLAFNAAVSFATNTDWQAYVSENSMSYLSQCLAFTVQNFLSVATSLAILMAFIRGLVRCEVNELGNYWVDIVRSILYILLPMATILAIVLVSQGVIQNFKAYQTANLLDPISYQEQSQLKTITTQTIPMGPVASLVAIKQLGSNGGGFFNSNSAHPFENPSLFSNMLQMLAIILLPAALCYTFGLMINDRRQGWMLLIAMCIIFIPAAYITIRTEQVGNPLFYNLQVADVSNMEGKETRLGVINSALWATATTATSNGSVNSMHDSHMPLSSIVYLMLMHIGEIIFGGVGSGLYGMLMMVLITVFVAGLMIGRTPEYLGKKVEPFEMKMAALVVLILPLSVLILSAIASVTKFGTESLGNPAAHGFSEILYAFSSLRNNNGSAFAGLNSNTLFYNFSGATMMLINRYWLAIATLAVAGTLVRKKRVPANAGTLDTHDMLFVFLLIGIIAIIGALSFVPTLALGPIVEHLMIWGENAS